MLQITVREKEVFDEANGTFLHFNGTTLNLEHSLVSISKWESKWHKAFISSAKHSEEETRDYIRCMTMNKSVDPNVYMMLSNKEINQVIDYIDDSYSAIKKEVKSKGGRQQDIPSEKIYFWMFSYGIPKDCERWHISRLLNLIDYFSEANKPNDPKQKRMSQKSMAKKYAEINAERCRRLGTKG